MTQEDFEATRDYLMKNVFVMTARQDQQLGYALDSKWYGIGEFTGYMREGLAGAHPRAGERRGQAPSDARNLSVVIVTKDAAGLKQALVADASRRSSTTGKSRKSCWMRTSVIGALKLNIAADDVRITPINDVFAR